MTQINPDCQKLLLSLKVTVEGLLVNQVRNVWNIYGGLNRLYLAVERIFKHNCRTIKEVNHQKLLKSKIILTFIIHYLYLYLTIFIYLW